MNDVPGMPGASGAAPSARVRDERRWLHVLAVGLAASLACLAPPAAGRTFTFADRAIAAAGENPPPAVSMRLGRLVDMQENGRAALAVGLMGLVLGVLSYVLPPRGESTRRFAAVGLMAAALMGLVLGAAAGIAARATFGLRHVGDQELAVASVIQGFAWGCAGCATGVAAGIRLANRPARSRAAGRGLAAGLLWGLAYPPLLALTAPWTQTERLIPEAMAASIAWSSIGVAAVGLAVGRVLGSSRDARDEASATKPVVSGQVGNDPNSTLGLNQE